MFTTRHRQDPVKLTLYGFFAVTALALVTLLASTYSSLIASRVAPGLPFEVVRVGNTAAPTLIIGEDNDITWNTRPDNLSRYPAEHISLCPINNIQLTPDCETLDFHTPNDGSATVLVPSHLAAGDYNLLFTAWDSNNELAFGVNNAIRTTVVRRLAATRPTSPSNPGATTVTTTDLQPQPVAPKGDSPISRPSLPTGPGNSPAPTSPPSGNTSLQLIVLNQQPITGRDPIQFSLSNIDPSDINCVTVAVDYQPVDFTGSLTPCD